MAPLVDTLAPDGTANFVVEFTTVATEVVITMLLAVPLFVRGSAAWRGLALGMVTASFIGLVFASLHLAMNANAPFGVSV
ncbi:hypothetical protein FK531_20420 [Rhodococcus spelaei]|uniref:Uncharacterized protein n=1 Tax=Rhodococcus spelaei TaxID=2546320 RepID=A0A541B0L6_9NOCA|nr:hypothetical protein FK531_20420 [Rhodococcus spelaei]